MKFVTFTDGARAAVPGALLEDLSTIVDLSAEFTDILALLDAGDAGLERARQTVAAAKSIVRLADVKLLAPLPNPRRLRDCALFEEHMLGGARWAEKMGIQHLAKVPDVWYQQPIYYKGNHLAISGTDAEIAMPSYAKLLDYELELGIIIGKPGKNIAKESALD
ncbi:MAG: fumarylacetoacetate hydrolase family protein, partial [Acidobacteriota bacterium]